LDLVSEDQQQQLLERQVLLVGKYEAVRERVSDGAEPESL
jgi:hypothetical protein